MKTQGKVLCFMTGSVIALLACTGESLPETTNEPPTPASIHELRLPVSACDPGLAPCTLAMPGGEKLTVGFSEHPPKALKPFTVLATLGMDADIRAMRLVLSGADMNMGTFNQTLVRDAAGFYQGDVVLPVCMSGAMRWQMDLIVEYDTEQVIAPFIFSVGTSRE